MIAVFEIFCGMKRRGNGKLSPECTKYLLLSSFVDKDFWGFSSIIDHEFYHLNQDEGEMNDTEEMQQWGIVPRPALNCTLFRQ